MYVECMYDVYSNTSTYMYVMCAPEVYGMVRVPGTGIGTGTGPGTGTDDQITQIYIFLKDDSIHSCTVDSMKFFRPEIFFLLQ